MNHDPNSRLGHLSCVGFVGVEGIVVKRLSIAGQRFGRLTATELIGVTKNGTQWGFNCDCGNYVIRTGHIVLRCFREGKISSCGCLIKERATTHGMRQHRAYAIWTSMIGRCTNRKNPAWEFYGGRGISVCDEWRDFENFWRDMGAKYRSNLTLDRIDNGLGYSASNCRWATMKQQARNKRNNVYIETPRGSITLAEASEVYNIPYGSLLHRVRSGWNHHDAIFIPINSRKSHKRRAVRSMES